MRVPVLTLVQVRSQGGPGRIEQAQVEAGNGYLYPVLGKHVRCETLHIAMPGRVVLVCRLLVRSSISSKAGGAGR